MVEAQFASSVVSEVNRHSVKMDFTACPTRELAMDWCYSDLYAILRTHR
jgi:hypothetical protein